MRAETRNEITGPSVRCVIHLFHRHHGSFLLLINQLHAERVLSTETEGSARER